MKKIDIKYFRHNIEKNTKDEINFNLISNLLLSKGLVEKQSGLCAAPWNKYFSIYKNTYHVVLNYNTSTRKRKKYYCSLQINYINNFYYICCLSQSSYFKSSIGAEHTVYEIQENEFPNVLDEIFNDVE